MIYSIQHICFIFSSFLADISILRNILAYFSSFSHSTGRLIINRACTNGSRCATSTLILLGLSLALLDFFHFYFFCYFSFCCFFFLLIFVFFSFYKLARDVSRVFLRLYCSFRVCIHIKIILCIHIHICIYIYIYIILYLYMYIHIYICTYL